jgi:hypothetical protein
MLVLPMATTDRIGSLATYSSVPARGFMAFADADSIATILAVGVSGAVALTVDSVAGVLTDGDAVSPDAAAASLMAVVSPAVRLAADSEAALEVSIAAEDSTVEAASTAAVPTAADTGNCTEKSTIENCNGWQYPLPAVFVFRALESGNSVA